MKAVVWIVILVIVLGGAYLYRSQIKALFMGGTAAPVSYSPTGYTPPTTGTTSPAASGDVITWMTGAKGQYAVAANGMTLYIFDKDTKGVSNCSGSCAGVWPPYTTASAPTKLPANVTLITRTDGSMQYAYKGMPLYYYSGDSAPGDIKGDGFNGIWHLVSP